MSTVVIQKSKAKLSPKHLQDLYDIQGPLSEEFTSNIKRFMTKYLSKILGERYTSLSDEIFNHCYLRLMDRIVPKYDEDTHTTHCFYIKNGIKKSGYDRNRRDIGTYTMSVVNFGVKDFDYYNNRATSYLLHEEELENFDKVCSYENSSLDVKAKNIEIDTNNISNHPSVRLLVDWLTATL